MSYQQPMNLGVRQLAECPLCASRRLRYAFSRDNQRAVRCADCRFLFLNPQPADALPAPPPSHEVLAEKARSFLVELARYRGPHGGRMLLLGELDNPLRALAEQAGFGVTQAEDATEHAGAGFDLCVLWQMLGQRRDPAALLKAAHGALKPGGYLAVATPSLDSLPARTLQQEWPAFRAGQLSFFDGQTLQTALFFAGFDQMIVEPARRRMNLGNLAHYCENTPRAFAGGLIRAFAKLAPRAVRQVERDVPSSDMLAFGRAAVLRAKRVLSIVVPAFNEAASFEELIEAVLAKEVPGLDIEVIVVESNSTDGTREIAQRYQSHPRVKLILEEKPRGKGHAVRTGLAEATGDFILIQDADLEYDLEDYDALLEPLITGREAFVLGSRHSGSVWKMRQFSGQAGLSAFLNFGHWFFTTLVNVLFGQRLKDPFTMFKVFRRDCLFGLTFECNRFDFDYELLVKLVRKGYRPLELPVNYRSRSFKQGKKVSMIRDPLMWLRALVKLRLATIDPLTEVAKSRPATANGKSAAGSAAAAGEKAFCL
ncbi:glycosyl transferase family 2 [Chthoniobacter flavus Ellin428]|uniref:Glycosyl transferase family 2 n=2 Tax=Chthoniobacter flavus TaxID=191863 RepID=B4D0U0_9BACT|nr:glycosyl transferase family 2 [Chthoniobacter flavus Ellin428]